MNELKNAHETLNLLHLLSPSAFHLLCLNWIFSRLFSPSVTFIIYIFMILVGYTLVPLHPAFIRSLTLTAFLLLFKNKQHDLIVFCILFLDFYFGTYHLMPMSYIFSFVILGHIYLLPSNFSMMKKVIISQLLLCLFFSQNFNIINFFFGFNLGLVFLPILTLIIFYFLLIPGTWPIIASWLELIFKLFLILVQQIAYFCQKNSYISELNSYYVLLVLLIIKHKWNQKQISIPLILICTIWSKSLLG